MNRFALGNSRGEFVVSFSRSVPFDGSCLEVTKDPARAQSFADYVLALHTAADVTRWLIAREAPGSDLLEWFGVRLWDPTRGRYVNAAGYEALAHYNAKAAALGAALPWLERMLAAQGDTPDPDLLALQHRAAGLLRLPLVQPPEQTSTKDQS